MGLLYASHDFFCISTAFSEETVRNINQRSNATSRITVSENDVNFLSSLYGAKNNPSSLLTLISTYIGSCTACKLQVSL